MNCKRCGHPSEKHVFEVINRRDPNADPCQLSCMVCFDLETERLKKEAKK